MVYKGHRGHLYISTGAKKNSISGHFVGHTTLSRNYNIIPFSLSLINHTECMANSLEALLRAVEQDGEAKGIRANNGKRERERGRGAELRGHLRNQDMQLDHSASL